MSYYGLKPEYYEEFQPATPWHQGAPGWSVAPIPGWGQNPNLRGPRLLATDGFPACGQDGSGVNPINVLLIGGGVLLLGWLVTRALHKSVRYRGNRPRRKLRRNACRGRGGPYLIPGEKKYPVPSKRCARTALTYAGWPNNLDDAPAVLRGLLKTKYAKDPDVRDQMRQLARVYREETGQSAPRV